MYRETQYEGPSNIIGLNRYIYDSKRRVMTTLVQEREWYTARVIDPKSGNVNQYARDFLIRVMKVVGLKGGALKFYALPVEHDGPEEVAEDDAVPMNADGYMIDEGQEHGYLLDVFQKGPRGLGALAAEATVEI